MKSYTNKPFYFTLILTSLYTVLAIVGLTIVGDLTMTLGNITDWLWFPFSVIAIFTSSLLIFSKLIERDRTLYYHLAAEATNDGIWELKGEKMSFSERWYEITGYSEGDIKGVTDFYNLIHPDDLEFIKQTQEHTLLRNDTRAKCEFRLQKKTGEYIWLHSRYRILLNEKNNRTRIVGTHTNITAVKDYKNQLHQNKYYDRISGLRNRVALNKDLEAAYVANEKLVAFYIDVDNFKFVNDFMSHELGDELLLQISQRIRDWKDALATAYRLSADEFVVLTKEDLSNNDTKRMASTLLRAFRMPFDLRDGTTHITVSIGVASAPSENTTYKNLIKHADIAMYLSKERGGNTYTLHDPHMTTIVNDRIRTEKHLRHALANNELDIHYQPIVSLQNKTIVGFEALIRWNSKLPPPSSIEYLIEVAEFTMLIVPIGEWVLTKACQFGKRLHNLGYHDITISVNISIIQLFQEGFANTVSDILAATEFPPDYLVLEITESVLMESYDLVQNELDHLRQMGIRIALDDFGKGYSSLSYLKSLPINTLKIDRSFVQDIISDGKDRTITGKIISIADNLGLCVIAEGVEEPEQLEYLVQHNCDNYQGYLFSKPVPEDAGIALLATEKKQEVKLALR